MARRVQATPPGICPVAVQLPLLQAAVAQSCGKCVPCRDGLPQVARMLARVAACESDAEEFAAMQELARMVRDTSDCAIGWRAADMLLKSIEEFADEYESHITRYTCEKGVGQTIPCETMCPAHVDIPAYIALAAQGDFAGSINTIRKDNPFPTACAFVCEHPCEERCRRTIVDAPINIRGIKKYAVDQLAADQVAVPKRGVATGRHVAVVGGGPSGLTCAYYLALMGHAVTVFEARAQLGGMMRYGIPAYRFPRERLNEDIRAVLSAGDITVKTNTAVSVDDMRRMHEEFDAVYVAIGAQAGNSLRIPGADAEGVYSAVELLGRIGDGDYPDFTGKKVVVVGGGNVAMDCARTSVRAGAAEVSCVYRRRQEDMTALRDEVEAAVAEGVEMITLQSPAAIEVDETGRCTALITQPQMIGAVRNGRPAPKDADKPQERIEADVVLVAIGQVIESAPFEEFGMAADRGRFRAGEDFAAEGPANVFVGGDCQSGPATVIKAIGAGKVAATSIDRKLGYNHSIDWDLPHPEVQLNDRAQYGRVNIAERPARERKRDFLAVEGTMSREEAVQECGRCLRCDVFGCGAQVGGRVQND